MSRKSKLAVPEMLSVRFAETVTVCAPPATLTLAGAVSELVPEFEEAIAALPLKQVSEPIQSRYGWHLAEVLERREHDTTDEVKREECARSIRQSKAEEERELWLRRLRDQAYVDVRR